MAGWTGSGVEPRTAAEIAAAVRQGKSSVRGAVQEALDRIAAADPRIGAFRKVRQDAALAEADEVAARPDLADLPLAGVPVAVKDNVAVADEQCRHGTAATADLPPQPEDHPVVARLRAAGAIVVGLTHTPELSLVAMTDSALGMVRNPWDLTRTPGGSSGGAAAAVAAGLVPIAHGNDGLGSIRGPAACCGLFGLKPGYGTVPSGLGRNAWWGLAENGPLATTVEDAALMLSVLADDPELARAVDTRPETLRIAVSNAPPSVGLPRRPGAQGRGRKRGRTARIGRAHDRPGAALSRLSRPRRHADLVRGRRAGRRGVRPAGPGAPHAADGVGRPDAGEGRADR